jgi:hypothetical protein
VGAVGGEPDGLLPCSRGGDGEHARPGCHHVGDPDLVEADDAADHVARLPLQSALTMRLLDDRVQFLVGALRLVAAAASDQPR